MLEQEIKDGIARRLKDSHLRQLIAKEMAHLLYEKPPEFSFDDYCQLVSSLIIQELHEYLLGSIQPASAVPGVPEHELKDTPSLDTVIQKLTASVEFALLSGNLQMVKALGGAIAQRDTGTSEHNLRVTIYCTYLAEALDCTRDEMQSIIKGAFLHDLGKIGISDSILLKPAGLTEEERKLVHSHPDKGAHIIDGVKWLIDALPTVKYHHEHFDGTGYPEGLKGEDIPMGARIFAVVDVFDALASERPYKKRIPFEATMAMMQEGSGKHFDPTVMDKFSDIALELYVHFSDAEETVLNKEVHRLVKKHFGIDLGEFKWT